MKLQKNDLNFLLKRFENKVISIDELLQFCTDNRCSDLYVKVGEQPYISRYGRIYKVPCFEVTNKIWNQWADIAISSENNSKYVRSKMLDFSYEFTRGELDNLISYRYRVSVGFSTGKNIATFRMITIELPSFETIDFPQNVANLLKQIAQRKSKITMLVGATGSGKSILDKQKVSIFRDGTLMEILWKDLKIKDSFIDGSIVEYIAPWEYRPCYKLTLKEKEIVVSDEHLFKCLFKTKNNKIVIPITIYGNEQITYWASSDYIFNSLGNLKAYLYDNVSGEWNVLEKIEPYECGLLQKCRCIKTNTGEYQIDSFVNHNTTTLASCINDFSQNGGPFENSVIISLEDPIEYIYPSTDKVKIVQKELGVDFKEYALGVKQALREHPNFVNVGETRDKETINTLIEASRTGHGIWTSFHAIDVPDTIARLYNQACSDGNNSIMYDLIANMNMILCQKIVSAGDHFKLNLQYMIFTPEIVSYLNNMIEKGKNIPNEIGKLFKNQDLIKSGIIKDWD